MATCGTNNSKFEVLVKRFEELGFGKQESLQIAHKGLEYKEKEKDKRKEQKSEDVNFRSCSSCGEKGKHRCTGCYLEMYCSKLCQKKDWKKGHKALCKVDRTQFKEVKLTPPGLEALKMKVVCDKEASTQNFVVKIAATMDIEFMPVVSKDDGYLGRLYRLPGQEELYDKMRKEVIERGVKWEGLYAGCYYALYKGPIENGGHNLEINPDKMQPMATW